MLKYNKKEAKIQPESCWSSRCGRKKYAMLAFLVDAAYLVGGLLGILLLLLPFLGLLAVCVIYLMFDIIEGFRKRRGLP